MSVRLSAQVYRLLAIAALKPSAVTDLACRLWALEQAAQLDTLRQQGLAILEWSPEMPLELVFAALTQRRHVRRAAR